MTERQQFEAMLAHATPRTWDRLEIRTAAEGIEIYTGPDDAVATFLFDVDGRLTRVTVNESGGDLPRDRSRG